jgi:hypothetical protein
MLTDLWTMPQVDIEKYSKIQSKLHLDKEDQK